MKAGLLNTKTPVEIIQLDEGSSFKLLHHKVRADNFLWNYHCHPEWELVYVCEGTGRRHVGNHLSYYQDGDLVLIGPELPHSGFGYGSEGVHEEIVVQFKSDTFGRDTSGIPEIRFIETLWENARYGMCFYGQTKKEVGEKIRALPGLSSFERFLVMMGVLKELAASKEYIVLNGSVNTYGFTNRDQDRLRKIYEHLEQNYHQGVDIEKVAALVNLSVPAFCNYFKRMVSMTYTDFVNDYRIRKACQMLVTPKSMLDISFECGFSSQSYFSKVFKKVKGKTPMEFRNELIMRA